MFGFWNFFIFIEYEDHRVDAVGGYVDFESLDPSLKIQVSVMIGYIKHKKGSESQSLELLGRQ
jgi:hypothetical protein